MGAKTSAEMKRAQKMIAAGKSAAEAARAVGLTRGAISHSQWYKDYVAKNKDKAASK